MGHIHVRFWAQSPTTKILICRSQEWEWESSICFIYNLDRHPFLFQQTLYLFSLDPRDLNMSLNAFIKAFAKCVIYDTEMCLRAYCCIYGTGMCLRAY